MDNSETGTMRARITRWTMVTPLTAQTRDTRIVVGACLAVVAAA